MELCFSSQSLFSTSFCSPKPSIRRHFLGSSHNLRPPGGPLFPPTKCRRLTIRRSNSPGILINASFGSDSVLLFVAVSAVSAVSYAYFNYHFNNRSNTKKNSKLALGSLSYELSRFGRNVVNHIVGTSGSKIRDVMTLELQGQQLAEKATENGYVIEAKEGAHIQVLENTLNNESSVLVEATESVNAADYAVCSASKHQVSVESEASNLSPPHIASPESEIVPSLVLARGISELTTENIRNTAEFDTEFPHLIVEESNIASVSIVPDEVDEKNEYNGITEESSRDGLYTFYEEKQSTVKSSPKLNGFNAASSLVADGFPLLKLNGAVKDAELLKQPSLRTSESVEQEERLAHFRRGLSNKNEKIGKKQFPREIERRNLTQNDHAKSSEFASPNGIDTINKDDPSQSQQDYIYNGLLRDRRLAECVDFLEDMERRGLLDMSKIYHAKFFKICKEKKAVKEAFRFCKLIPNPTLSTFNMLMTVCVSSQDSEGAFKVLQFAEGAGLKADCKLYTTLISTCAKSGKVDAMFEVFHKMVNAGVEPNLHTYGALIDGCGRAGQMAKAFGAYGILRSKNVKPDRVVFNALISACGQSGAVDRAFDVLAEMGAETQPVDPDHVTVGALIKACAKAGQVDRAKEVYNMMNKYNIKGTPEVYTIAVSCCSQTGDWEFAQCVYDDMTRKGVAPDEMFLSALIDVAGHAGMVDAAFETLREARNQGRQFGIIPYSSLMGACCNAKNWQKALELYEDLKSFKLKPAVSFMNALITALCDGDQLSKAIEVLSEMKSLGLRPNTITYSVLFVASERKNDLEVGCRLLSQIKEDSIAPTLIMYKCIIGMCLRRYEKACAVGEPVLSLGSDQPQLKNEWTNLALSAYRETIAAGEKPTMDVISQVLGCLRLPYDASLKKRVIENLSVTADSSKFSNLCCLVDGFGEYDPRAFSLLEEAASLGTVPSVSFNKGPIFIDAKSLQIHIAEVYLLKTLKGLKHRLAAGAKLPNVTILLPVDTTQIMTPEGEKKINLAGRLGQEVASLLRRLGVPYQGNESYGKIRINGISLRRWLQPKLASPFSGRPEELNLNLNFNSSLSRIGKGILHQQRNIRTGDFHLE